MNRTLLLDLDGTLVDSVPDLADACNRLLAGHGLPPFREPEIAAMVGDGAAALVRSALSAHSRTATPADVTAFLADYSAHAADRTRPYPHAAETLRALRHAGWTLVVCTNKPAAPARALLGHLGLLPLLHAVVGGDGPRKPDPAHLHAALARCGGTAGRAVMLGDHHNDIAAAKAAGLPVIFAAWGYGPATLSAQADATAQALADVPALAERLLPPQAAA